LAKRSNSGGIATLVGRELGKLAARKDALARQLASVEREMASVRDSVTRALGGGIVGSSRKVAKAATKRAKRVMSPEARAKMAEAAKRRWAAAKKAGKKTLG
jgi:hypothetical protein